MSWKRMRSSCYARQVNRDELVAAMCSVIRDREHWAAAREQLAAESVERFHPDRCIQKHVSLLNMVIDSRHWPSDNRESIAVAGT
jgi:glycosyltransferase involved in cell wall biosynthesis